MHIHILGICGTFMGGLALLARELGHTVSGSDENVYPPMSTQLADAGIRLHSGYDPAALNPAPDLVLIGNALSRGNSAVEYVLNRGLRYQSGAAWLADAVLQQRWVVGVAGTHGKTTTTSLVAWILDYAGLQPGFLIGGVASNFGISARLGNAPFFVIEADEYDTAFFDKRSKFVHYHARTAILNNLEFDHADIYPDLAAIETQFHHLLRTVPGEGKVIYPADDAALARVLARGCWSAQEKLHDELGWQARNINERDNSFDVYWQNQLQGRVNWSLLGGHNRHNALAALAAARHCGVPVAQGIAALAHFNGIKRRLELRGEANGIRVYDDFAHHPTAIATTLAGLRAQVGAARIIAIVDPRSATMKMGVHKDTLAPSLAGADAVLLHKPGNLAWQANVPTDFGKPWQTYAEVDAIVEAAKAMCRPGDHVLVMSNGGFGGIHDKLLAAFAA
ncbi:UDP-N-acetylmuramate:L-alanyl-gamma-D-glutamyl-meso-diaminopimelate ligase [Permianibacter sp. IMCC34836]|uniref:UDP-N-acetylmuramate:L-alanyl-gamma-D-glutamyl- meso-diaminopimelate ligase n=1 Tax=Permianibacter fluminis TaxID=2738515 RepID=UPI001554832B|nr:UDP-N-acetylmuramate:L-alanyl-gamma-D-glutamyl-meso-diaminopimelate ligase [Permianibacter fluminis]NQD36680.1 UDP-N-acetylmuramate:L-alanyl-gamma-D-glutamyl-meso-diaminopimelate ligase [Permianibacter fluminis]